MNLCEVRNAKEINHFKRRLLSMKMTIELRIHKNIDDMGMGLVV